MNYNFEDIKNSLQKAIKKLKQKDCLLLKNDANERSISHKLAEYLQQEFQDWNVDCEYNRNGGEDILGYITKKLNLSKDEINWDDTEAKTVYPDIIIHIRNTNKNLLVIEMKKSSSSVNKKFDKEKLKKFTEKPLSYNLGAYIEFKTGPNYKEEPIIVECYEKGKKKKNAVMSVDW